ncbi:GNAT family N-acetyltransferase [Azospirillum thermophilum]|uniref:GNAT family N-acetyltransferase n=1 Tax=Azospirillum thermophilum TaxID=2202148 RepID=A0A2S2CM44_9PROT|nr:GNAT family N-acetyltransferase [Azospirillum thermophilum]AWK85585.1 GNAT family N-acetyltransferase [Azospirillum thermophilum]
MLVRDSRPEDMEAARAIYAHHVLTGLASFEETPPDRAELVRRREDVLARGLPYLVAELDGRVVGFAYAGPYRLRSAYRFAVEDSIYVDPALVGQGVGRALLTALIDRTTAAGFRQMIAVIGDSANSGSIALHGRCGFRQVGVLQAVGFKFGRWVDSILMQRPLGDGDASLPPD